jgi:hypothetical protein
LRLDHYPEWIQKLVDECWYPEVHEGDNGFYIGGERGVRYSKESFWCYEDAQEAIEWGDWTPLSAPEGD